MSISISRTVENTDGPKFEKSEPREEFEKSDLARIPDNVIRGAITPFLELQGAVSLSLTCKWLIRVFPEGRFNQEFKQIAEEFRESPNTTDFSLSDNDIVDFAFDDFKMSISIIGRYYLRFCEKIKEEGVDYVATPPDEFLNIGNKKFIEEGRKVVCKHIGTSSVSFSLENFKKVRIVEKIYRGLESRFTGLRMDGWDMGKYSQIIATCQAIKVE